MSSSTVTSCMYMTQRLSHADLTSKNRICHWVPTDEAVEAQLSLRHMRDTGNHANTCTTCNTKCIDDERFTYTARPKSLRACKSRGMYIETIPIGIIHENELQKGVANPLGGAVIGAVFVEERVRGRLICQKYAHEQPAAEC